MFDDTCQYVVFPVVQQSTLNIASAAIIPLLIALYMDALDSTCIERTGITTNQQTTR